MFDKVNKDFYEFFTNSFNDGRLERELRLSKAEVDFLSKSYPNITIQNIDNNKHTDKSWYLVKLKSK